MWFDVVVFGFELFYLFVNSFIFFLDKNNVRFLVFFLWDFISLKGIKLRVICYISILYYVD